jgi:hypothetical protein
VKRPEVGWCLTFDSRSLGFRSPHLPAKVQRFDYNAICYKQVPS